MIFVNMIIKFSISNNIAKVLQNFIFLYRRKHLKVIIK